MDGGSSVKGMTTNFGKLDKFEGRNHRRWQKKIHFLLTTLNVVYVLSTPMLELLEDDDTLESVRLHGRGCSSKKFLVSKFKNYKMVDSRPVMEQFNKILRILGQYTQHDLKMDESIYVSSVIDKLPPSWKGFKHSLKHGKDDLSLVQLDSHLRIEESLRVQESDKGKGKEVDGPSMNMMEEGGKNKKQNKGKKCGFKDNDGSGSNKKPKLACWKCGKTGHFKKDCHCGNKKDNATFYVQVDAIAWWIDSGATTHVCKCHCWFKTCELVKDGSVLYMGDDHFAPIHGKGSVVLEFNSGKSITLFNELNMHQRRWIELFSDYECKIHYHPGKSNVVGDALSRKERVKSRRVKGMILASQSKAFKQENVLAERLHGLDQQMERKRDESLCFMHRIWVLLVGSVMDEAHASRNLVHPGADKTYYKLGDMYW
ncbi:zinc finger, CCHC-type containing protein [Tanacetum coccineum]